MRAFEFIVSTWLAFIILLAFSSIQFTRADHGRSATDPTSGPSVVLGFYSILNIHIYNYHHHQELPYYFVYLRGVHYVFVALCAAFVRRLKFGPHEQPSSEAKNESKPRPVRRSLGIASGGVSSNLCDLGSLKLSIPNTPRVEAGRGRRFTLQDLSSVTTPPLWHMKDHHTSFSQKDRMPSFTTVMGRLKEGSGAANRKLDEPKSSLTSRMRLCSVQAPLPLGLDTDELAPASKECTIFGRLKRVKTKLNSRFLPYPNLLHLSTQRRRGLTSAIPEPRHVGRKSSLETALFGDPQILQPDQIIWFVLVVAVDYLGLQDPEHDLEFWKTMLDDPILNSEIIYFIKLAGEEATPENIRKELAQMYHDSEALGKVGRPNLFVYLTGEGDDQNRMCLLGGKSVSEEEIDRWLTELRTECGYARPITLALDICRSNKDKPGTKMSHGIDLICSASPGEQAKAIRFESDQAKPYSCFILAFIAASVGSLASTSVNFKAEIEQHLNQLIALMNSAPSKRISDGDDDGVSSQTPDWSRGNHLSTFFEFAKMISRTRIAQEIYDFVVQYYTGKESLGPGGTADYRPLPENHTTQHLRGANGNVPAVCT